MPSNNAPSGPLLQVWLPVPVRDDGYAPKLPATPPAPDRTLASQPISASSLRQASCALPRLQLDALLMLVDCLKCFKSTLACALHNYYKRLTFKLVGWIRQFASY